MNPAAATTVISQQTTDTHSSTRRIGLESRPFTPRLLVVGLPSSSTESDGLAAAAAATTGAVGDGARDGWLLSTDVSS